MLTQDRYQTILIEKAASGVATATLNRPEKLNAINARMHTELATLTLEFVAGHRRVPVIAEAELRFQIGTPPFFHPLMFTRFIKERFYVPLVSPCSGSALRWHGRLLIGSYTYDLYP